MSGVIRPWALRAAGILLAVLVAGSGAGALGASSQEPGVGRFLVASRHVRGGFAHTVILLVEHGQAGSLGLIVNRPTRLPLAHLLPEVEELRGRPDVVYLGGPVGIDRLTLLIRSRKAPPDAIRVLSDVFASGSVETLHALAGKAADGATFHAYIGYAGWAPGQLGFEIARGDWFVTNASADSVFAGDPSGLWRRLVHQQAYIEIRFVPMPKGRVLAAPR